MTDDGRIVVEAYGQQVALSADAVEVSPEGQTLMQVAQDMGGPYGRMMFKAYASSGTTLSAGAFSIAYETAFEQGKAGIFNQSQATAHGRRAGLSAKMAQNAFHMGEIAATSDLLNAAQSLNQAGSAGSIDYTACKSDTLNAKQRQNLQAALDFAQQSGTDILITKSGKDANGKTVGKSGYIDGKLVVDIDGKFAERASAQSTAEISLDAENHAASTAAGDAKVGSDPDITNGKVQRINPDIIRFSQSSVNNSAETIQSMKANGWLGDPIDVIQMPDGSYTTIDNTRVVAAREAKIDVEAFVHAYDEKLPAKFVPRFTTEKGVPETWGDAIALRIRKKWDGGRFSVPPPLS